MKTMINVSKNVSRVEKRRFKYSKGNIRESLELYSLIFVVLILIFIFCYWPMYGILIAFQDYYPGSPILAFDGSIEWVGLKHFRNFFQGMYFTRLMKNTILLSIYKILFGFWVPIAFALLLNEIRLLRYKKFVQTASYLPHFISNVVVAGMVISFLQPDGLINNVIAMLGGKRVAYTMKPEAFPIIYVITSIWKSFGFDSILYLSAISAIDPYLYESSKLDGATRWQQVRYITIPSIMPTIAIMLIMDVGRLVSSNTDLILLLYNPATYKTADVIGTFVYRDGIQGGNFSFSTAIGLFASTINFGMVFIANKISNKLTNFGLW
jgi:putative aldouronate transport system permease protein